MAPTSESAPKAPRAKLYPAARTAHSTEASERTRGFADLRDRAIVRRRLRDLAGSGPRARGVAALQDGVTLQLLKKSQITSRLGTNGASVETVWALRTSRPPYAQGQVEAVWDAAQKDGQGRAICPNTQKLIAWTKGWPREGVWDMGYKTGHEYRTLWLRLAQSEITYATFLQEYQNPANYQVEDPKANRSHGFEAGVDDG